MKTITLWMGLLLTAALAQAETAAVPGQVSAIDFEAMANLDQEFQEPERRGKPRRDPFAASEVMLIEAGRYTPGSAIPGGGFLPTSAAKPPKMRRLGFVYSGKSAVALLEVEGVGVYQVRDGDSISLHAIGRQDSIKVRHVDSLTIEVQVGTVNSIIVR